MSPVPIRIYPLMAGKTAWLDADTEISVNVRSAIEWRPDEWD